MRVYIGIVLMMVMVGCTPPGPLSEGEGTSPDSPAAARHLFGVEDDWRVEHFMWLVHVCVERSRIFAKILEG